MIVENIRCLCRERGTSVCELEKVAGLGNGTIGRWNRSSPRVDSLQRVADYFGISISDLLRESNEAGTDRNKN